jgi:putative hemolysin
MKWIFTFTIILLTLSACTALQRQASTESTTTNTPQAGIPNQASFYCEQNGNKHEIVTAVGFTTGGKEISSKMISAVFVSKEEGSAASLKMVVPILAVVFGAMVISAITTMVNARKGKKLPAGAARSYSFGGGIYPKCKRPFGFQLLGIHMFGRKLTPCPQCGKWSVVKRATMGELLAAELAELEPEKAQIHDAPNEEKIKKELNDSNYQNL